MNRFRKVLHLIAMLAMLAVAAPALAQTSLTTTTTSAAISSKTAQVIALTSAASINAKDILVIDNEAMEVQSCNTTNNTCLVTRGRNATYGQTHAITSVVYAAPPKGIYKDYVVGTCTSTQETYLPHIVLPDGNAPYNGIAIFDCLNSEWVRFSDRGRRVTDLGRTDGGTTYTSLGAITVQPGLSFINGTTLAMTLANPTVQQNGMIMVIIATNASAHTVTYTAGFDGGTTARDVATYGGAVGDNMVIMAFNGVWWVLSTRNVTFG